MGGLVFVILVVVVAFAWPAIDRARLARVLISEEEAAAAEEEEEEEEDEENGTELEPDRLDCFSREATVDLCSVLLLLCDMFYRSQPSVWCVHCQSVWFSLPD